MEFQCREMAEETVLGHLRRSQLVKQWEGRTMRVEITRKASSGNERPHTAEKKELSR
jgi:hypothetical protein